jgi:protein TonB
VTFFDFQVEKQVAPAPGSAQPTYPEPLRVARVAGEVLAQFAVDTMGVVDLETFKVLASTDPWFTSSVYDAMSRMRFKPAEKGGQKVRELVQQPYAFNLR